MGGIGSGRRLYDKQYDSKRTTEDSLPLDVRKMHREGCLKRGYYTTWRWWYGDDSEEAKARGNSIGCLCTSAAVDLFYQYQGEPVRQSVKLEWTPCHYGGERPWWRCPSCHKRVAVLYIAGKYFACRHCYGLCYTSQKENFGDRALRQAWKIRKGLGQQGGGHFDMIPDKPKGMHWKTYSRLAMRCRGYEHDSWAQVVIWLNRMDGKSK